MHQVHSDLGSKKSRIRKNRKQRAEPNTTERPKTNSCVFPGIHSINSNKTQTLNKRATATTISTSTSTSQPDDGEDAEQDGRRRWGWDGGSKRVILDGDGGDDYDAKRWAKHKINQKAAKEFKTRTPWCCRTPRAWSCECETNGHRPSGYCKVGYKAQERPPSK